MPSHNAISAAELAAPASIIFTQSAAQKVHNLIVEEDNPDLNLRVYITGGGCSGFQYGFTFDTAINADDTVVEKQIADADADQSSNTGAVVRLLIDAMSFQYLVGAEIDYVEDLQGAQFVIRNPNAKTSCGCGSSFSV